MFRISSSYIPGAMSYLRHALDLIFQDSGTARNRLFFSMVATALRPAIPRPRNSGLRQIINNCDAVTNRHRSAVQATASTRSPHSATKQTDASWFILRSMSFPDRSRRDNMKSQRSKGDDLFQRISSCRNAYLHVWYSSPFCKG